MTTSKQTTVHQGKGAIVGLALAIGLLFLLSQRSRTAIPQLKIGDRVVFRRISTGFIESTATVIGVRTSITGTVFTFRADNTGEITTVSQTELLRSLSQARLRMEVL